MNYLPRLVMLLALLVTMAGPPVHALEVTICRDPGVAPVQFAAAEIRAAVQAAGGTAHEKSLAEANAVAVGVRLILARNGDAVPGWSGLPTPSAAQSYAQQVRTVGGLLEILVVGADATGAMYGGLDLAEAVQTNALAEQLNADRTPRVPNRGIKFNIPLDARTPSYNDNGDSAQANIATMWDLGFWQEFLDEMARDRLNMLSLWTLAPFPSLVDVTVGSNHIALNDVKKTTVPPSGFGGTSLTGTNMSTANTLSNLVTVKTLTMAQKMQFWQQVMQYAQDRGVDCYIFTWNTFVYGTEGTGFTADVNDSNTRAYFRKATETLLGTYPLLKGLGLTAGENMVNGSSDSLKEGFLYNAYGQGINDALAANPGRTFQLIHRAHQTNIANIKSAFAGLNPRCTLSFSYKYAIAHMYASTAPDYIRRSPFLNDIGTSNYFYTVRDDDWYYLRGGSDPAFARAYVQNFFTNGPNNAVPHADRFQGFYLGPDGYTWGREALSREPDATRQSLIKKRWYSFRMWGKLAYDPAIPDSSFVRILGARFPEANAQNLYTAWAKGSQVIPLVNRFHSGGTGETRAHDFRWYPEACYSESSQGGFNTVNHFINDGPQNAEGIMWVNDYANQVVNNQTTTGITPDQVALSLMDMSSQALSLTASMRNASDKELRLTINDITAMAYLGQYYAEKISGAGDKAVADRAAEPMKSDYRARSIQHLRNASNYWRLYANRINTSYVPQYLSRMLATIDMTALQTQVDNDVSLAGGTPLPALPANSVLMVVGSTALSAGDTALKNRLQALGYAVTVIDDNLVTAGSSAGMVLVLISESAESATGVGQMFATMAVPVMTSDSGFFAGLKLTAPLATDFGTVPGQSQVTIADPTHALAAGLSGTVTVVTSADTFDFGVPAASAHKVATLAGQAGKYTLFAYENGAQMVAQTAPARRVAWFAEDSTPTKLNTNGWALFDAAVVWATAPPGNPGPMAPIITSSLADQTVYSGQTATFTVTAGGTMPLTYTWKRGSTTVGGSSAILSIANAQSGDAGSYTCTVSNSVGSAVSAAAVLTVATAGSGSFQQGSGSDGLLVIEAENPLGTRTSAGGQSWQTVTTIPGFSGSGAVESGANIGTQIATNYVGASPAIAYPVNFTHTGTHYLWLRGLAATTTDNSVHFGLDNAGTATSENLTVVANNAYGWNRTDASSGGTVRTISVPSIGLHTLHVWMREDGLVMDRILITSNASYVPSGSGPAESTTGGAALVPADANGDGVVDALDLTLVRSQLGRTSADTGFDARADLNDDARVNAIDLGIVVRGIGP